MVFALTGLSTTSLGRMGGYGTRIVAQAGEHPMTPRVQLNGQIAGADDLRALALVNYGHFTSMQVCDGAVRGLGLHLQRLQRATTELFGAALDIDQTRVWMREALHRVEGAASVRVTVFSRALNRDCLLEAAAPDVLVAVGPARGIPADSLRVRSVRYQREAPHIKHVGTFGLFHQKRLAQAAGFDDALFVDAGDAIAEGSIWNVGFFDGTRVTWPDAPALQGISMQLLQEGLRRRGVPMLVRRVELGEIAHFRAAFFTNTSRTAVPLSCIDATEFPVDAHLLALLDECMSMHPWERI
jgi:branched-subunit amino acid aminotransferase/4-amino-4-deoxychorismate lyase